MNMSELVKLIEGLGSAVDDMRKAQDRSADEMKKGNEALAREFAEKADRANTDIDGLIKAKRELEAKMKLQQERIEILEAVSSRPGNTVQAKAKDEEQIAFGAAFRKGFQDMEANQAYKAATHKRRELEGKAVTIGTGADGGFAVPEEIAAAIESLVLKQSGVVANVQNITVGSSDWKQLVSIHGTTSGWVAETGSRAETGTANLRERAPTWGELYAYPKVSNWALEDIFFNVVNWLVADAGEGMAKALDAAIFNGNGSGKPTGIFNGAPVTTADYASPLRAAAVIQYVKADAKSPQQVNADDLIDLVYTLAPGYRSGAKFYMNTLTQGFCRKFKDTTGQYLWQPALQAGQPDRFLGYEVVTWEDLGNPTTGDAFPVVFGDMARGYVLTSRTGLAIDRNPFGTIGYTSFYIRKRYGGCVLNNDALKALKIED
jgi:HK97 family phage major capsid protein